MTLVLGYQVDHLSGQSSLLITEGRAVVFTLGRFRSLTVDHQPEFCVGAHCSGDVCEKAHQVEFLGSLSLLASLVGKLPRQHGVRPLLEARCIVGRRGQVRLGALCLLY